MHKPAFVPSIGILFVYCLPALLTVAVVLYGYQNRVMEVGNFVTGQHRMVECAVKQAREGMDDGAVPTLEAIEKSACLELIMGDETVSIYSKELIRFFIREHRIELSNSAAKNNDYEDLNGINEILHGIWLKNAYIIGTMAVLPFLLLGFRLAFSPNIQLNAAERLRYARQGFLMKFLIGFIIAYATMYLFNPIGRGVSTIDQFLVSTDLYRAESLPLFIKTKLLTPVLAGFLGWYLYLLSYFFTKLITDDVVSPRVYGVMLKKAIFTYGLALVLSPMQADIGIQSSEAAKAVNYSVQMCLALFLIGFFPVAALGLIRDTAVKLVKGVQTEKGNLNELPGISRWQILRLEEEGIDNLGALAYADRRLLHRHVPSLSLLIDYWIDIAQLYVIAGQSHYLKLSPYVQTASQFIIEIESGNQQFTDALKEAEVHNGAEIARLLRRTFGEHLCLECIDGK